MCNTDNRFVTMLWPSLAQAVADGTRYATRFASLGHYRTWCRRRTEHPVVRVERKCDEETWAPPGSPGTPPEDDMPFLWNVAVTCGAADKYPVQTFGLHLRTSARRTRHLDPGNSSPRDTTCLFHGGITSIPVVDAPAVHMFLATCWARRSFYRLRSSSPFCSIEGWKCKKRPQSDGPHISKQVVVDSQAPTT